MTILNPVAATIGALMKDEAWLRPGVNAFLLSIKERLFVTEKVKNIIFDGYHDPLFDNLEKMLDDLPFIKPFIPPGSLMDKFGFFYGRNGTDYIDGVWNMYTGKGDNSMMGKVTLNLKCKNTQIQILCEFRSILGITPTLCTGPVLADKLKEGQENSTRLVSRRPS